MSAISTLKPNLLWKWFEQICAIPHPSYHEEKLAQFIVNWAEAQNLFVERDDVGNILIRKPATTGMENRHKVALQAHLDMVPQANEDTEHNFETDPIKPYLDGEWVTAHGTTLGADNGIGMASCLAVLESNDLAHPELEVLLTMTEETGMVGANGLRPNWLQSDILINTDTEDNGEIYIGCAGGENASLDIPIQKAENPFDAAMQITLKGLRGGHSGCDIHTNRVNTIKLLARFLEAMQAEMQSEVPFQLVEIHGGTVRNAIPREAGVSVAFFAKNHSDLTAFIHRFEDQIKTELEIAEPNLTFITQDIDSPEEIFDKESTVRVINTLNALPNGVTRYSDAVEDVVESSLSVGVLRTEAEKVNAVMLTRSLIEDGKADIRGRLRSLATLSGSSVEFSGNYPGWKPDASSQITKLTQQIYDDILGYEAKIKVIHAGLECGLLKKVYPDVDMVSIGPTIRNAHSPDEKVHIPAVEIYWELLTKLLANIQ